jgi:cyclase
MSAAALRRASSLRLAAACAVVALSAPAVLAQTTRTTQVEGGVYMISGAGANVTVSVGDSGVLVVDTGADGMSAELLAAIRELSHGPIRYIVNTGLAADRTGGNAAIRAAGETFTGGNATVIAGVGEGAAIIAHENLLLRMASAPNVRFDALPTEPFYVQKTDLYFNGEPVEIIHQPNAVDDTDVIVHFRRSDVISTGGVFRLDGYPVFDPERGGGINGVLDALNGLLDRVVSDTLSEGGTLLVPSHGRISDEGDLVRYRDMITVIRDRVQAWMERGHGLEEILAMQPSFDYDSRYASPGAAWTAEEFIEAIYRSLLADRSAGAMRSAVN